MDEMSVAVVSVFISWGHWEHSCCLLMLYYVQLSLHKSRVLLQFALIPLSSTQMTSCWSSAASTKGWSTPERKGRRSSIKAWSPASSTPSVCAAMSTTTATSATKCAVHVTTTSATMCATSLETEAAWRAGRGPTARQVKVEVSHTADACSSTQVSST